MIKGQGRSQIFKGRVVCKPTTVWQFQLQEDGKYTFITKPEISIFTHYHRKSRTQDFSEQRKIIQATHITERY